MNGYVTFYRGERLEVHADTTFEAQQKAQAEFQKKHPRRKVKGYEVSVHLAEKAGQPVVHVAVN